MSSENKSSALPAQLQASRFRYGPCKRNHALGSGGNLLDGCQEFDAEFESSKICSACGCHRSFHARVSDDGREPQLLVPIQSGSIPAAEFPGAPAVKAFFTSAGASLVHTRENGSTDIRDNGTTAEIGDNGAAGNRSENETTETNRENITAENMENGAADNTENEATAEKPLEVGFKGGRKPCRSKQLRAKGCQIWSDYLRPWSAAHGINVRFCDNKESCVSEMLKGGHPLCLARCSQLKWPPHVPLAHPKDMASRELQAFINTYEQDWQEHCLRNHGFSTACTLLPRLKRDLDPCKVSTKELRHWLKENGKPVFCVHPKAANQFVNMGKLATMILRSGGKCKFEGANGWETFVSGREGMNKPALTSAERRKCVRTIKRLYNKFLMEFVQEALRGMGLENDGGMAAAEISHDGAYDEEDESGDTDGNRGGGSSVDMRDASSPMKHRDISFRTTMVPFDFTPSSARSLPLQRKAD